MTSLVVCWYKNCENQSQVGRVQCHKHTHQVTNNVILLCYSIEQISNRNKLNKWQHSACTTVYHDNYTVTVSITTGHHWRPNVIIWYVYQCRWYCRKL